jgi:peptidoglycan/LPS O-acetylase OafA/YrhL
VLDNKRSFITLDGLRGIAALAIVTVHAPAYFASVSTYVEFAGTAKPAVVVGPFFEVYLAVDFFFVLSGFVLAHAYGQRLHEGMTAARFMIIRLIRLYPLYLLALAVSALLAARSLAQGAIDPLAFAKDLSSAILFLPAPARHAGAPLFPLNYPAWSLFFELLANLGFGLIGRRLGKINLFAIVVISGLALIAAVMGGLFGFKAEGAGVMDAGFDWQSFIAGGLRVAYSFFAGVLVYRIWRFWHPSINVPHLAVALLLIAILVAHPSERYKTAFDLIVTILVFPALVWLGASSVASGFFARVFTWLGAASYGIYVIQAPLYTLTMRVLGKVFQGDTSGLGLTWGIGFMLFVFAGATLADRFLDRPVRTLLMARFVSPRAAVQPA